MIRHNFEIIEGETLSIYNVHEYSKNDPFDFTGWTATIFVYSNINELLFYRDMFVSSLGECESSINLSNINKGVFNYYIRAIDQEGFTMDLMMGKIIIK